MSADKGRHSDGSKTKTYRQATYPPPSPPREPKRGRHRVDNRKVGPRRLALEDRRRTRRRKQGAAGLGLTLTMVALVAAATVFTVNQVRKGPGPTPTPTLATGDTTSTTLLFGTKESHGRLAEALWLALLYRDAQTGTGGVMYIPAHTTTEIPGRGLLPVADALPTGGIPLLLVSIENMLGLDIDSYLELSDRDSRVFFEATGPIAVDVPSEVRVSAASNQARLLFTEGPQTLDAAFLEKLLFTIGIDGDEVELGGRHLTFWDALFRSFEEEPAALSQAVKKSGAAFGESDSSIESHAEMFEDLATLPYQQRDILLLPVTQVGVGGQELYAPNSEELEELVGRVLGNAARLDADVRIQVLNGNGVPGIGQMVADRLVGEGYRVILSGNAQHLDYKKTLIVTYDSSPEGQALAEHARDLLGVGEVQVSVQQQGIVELTIVVGKDFLKTL